jgi:hypothetical protein
LDLTESVRKLSICSLFLKLKRIFFSTVGYAVVISYLALNSKSCASWSNNI